MATPGDVKASPSLNGGQGDDDVNDVRADERVVVHEELVTAQQEAGLLL